MAGNFLEIDDGNFENKFLINPSEAGDSNSPRILTPSQRQEQIQCKFIIPLPGICVKTKHKNDTTKLFVNICHSEEVPPPNVDAYSDEEFANMLSDDDSNESNNVRIPMSIGEKHVEQDNSGSSCDVFDVIINSDFFNGKFKHSELYRTFVVVVSLEGIEEKYKLEVDKNYKILDNRKSFGKLIPQFVKQKAGIQELKSTIEELPERKMIEEVATGPSQLSCVVKQLSLDLAKAQIKLPNLLNAKKLSVSVGADRLIVESPVGSLDIFLPLDIHQEDCRADYNGKSKILTIHLPLVVKP